MCLGFTVEGFFSVYRRIGYRVCGAGVWDLGLRPHIPKASENPTPRDV